ncbi:MULTISPECIES: 50S ribosomal protein L31e [Sulfurisphaera]|uniref:Large ribosomal subunit protein eL31 n=3 Tax=Sulfurisphaera TaxID=69655 RepID=RL31_SULTO|nr:MULTISPECIES: 50S ribosomal protein L31e [Sulfurisphaera]Q971I2.1 RecName: Full=Large ribosomal subunit protein eL31; AltName: Full=50S ribosomal protein L31e [Sulfurisphaera tokodaii str. 7]MBB5252466.1 large subunit ribosomal protein L31e [Sulfurisphaera ohwakuensis]QGR17083.1 50S ribosomal protein L31e [Sulfurisphaera ohwakuensis]BAB66438.1 50S ribosomal protein L31e [Sulfurisphaera tokodaii str. 7]HII73748.1 50S ribosomal protein L31e [Sulfurisphaera tokodaii]
MKEKDNFEMVINFKRAFMGRRNQRTKRAIKMIRNIVQRHFGAEKVIIDPLLAKSITYNGRDKIVRKVRVAVKKIGEKTYLVRLALKSE